MEMVLANPHEANESRLEADSERKALRLFAFKLGVVAVWLGIGGFLAWLVHDFGQVSGFGQERLASVLIFGLFLISGFLVSMIGWVSYRNATSSHSA